jgi:hypothetical protein
MLDIEITRLIFAAIAAVLLGYACYVAAFVKHRNEIRDSLNKAALVDKATKGSATPNDVYDEYKLEKTETWYFGYRLALVGLIVVATAVGWAVSWAVGQDYVLSWVEDGALAAAGAIIGGFVLDKYIIHPIADGSFFEKVEDPLVQRFLQDAVPVVEDEVKKKRFSLFKKKRKEEEPKKEPETPSFNAPEVPPETVEEKDPIESMSFQQKVDLIEKLKRSL